MGKVQIITWQSRADANGTPGFVYLYNFTRVNRFHQLVNGYAAKCSFLFAPNKIDGWNKPYHNLEAARKIFKSNGPAMLNTLPADANGIKACEGNNLLTVYSNLSFEQSTAGRWFLQISYLIPLFDSSLWLNWNSILE
jgi:hypothetical protein